MSTKGGDTSMKEKRGRSPSLPRKVETGQHEKRGRSLSLPQKVEIEQHGKRGRSPSPSLPRKVEMGQRGRSPSPSLPRKVETGKQGRCVNPHSTQERKKALTLTESRKVPTIPRPSTTLSSILNPKKQPISEKTKPLERPTPPSKVMSTKSKYNPQNIVASSPKTSGSMKPKGSGTSRPPLNLKNPVNVKDTNINTKKKTSQTHEEHNKNIAIADDGVLILEDCDDKQHLDDENNDSLNGKVEFENGVQFPLYEPSESIDLDGDRDILESVICFLENVRFDHDDNIDPQDQAAEDTFGITSDHLPYPIVDHEETQIEKVEHEETIFLEELEPKEPEQEEPRTTKLPEIKEDGVDVPKGEDTISKTVVKTQRVVMHGKKEPAAAYNDVIEETVNKLRVQRKNRVLALVGAFETVILLESDVLKVS